MKRKLALTLNKDQLLYTWIKLFEINIVDRTKEQGYELRKMRSTTIKGTKEEGLNFNHYL